MKEKHVLASAIKDRKAYESIKDHVDRDDLSEQGWIIWSGIAEFYQRDDGVEYADAAILSSIVERTVQADKHKEMFSRLVQSLAEFNTSPANVVDDLLATKREAVGQRLAQELLSGRKPNGLLSEYERLAGTEGFESKVESRVGLSVCDLVAEKFNPEGLVQVWPESLNSRLDGGVKPGHHIVLFARPEMGKTMAVINMIAGFLDQDLRVLYVGNEDPLDDINMRVVNRLSGMDKYEVLQDPEKADLRVRERGYERLSLASLAPGTPAEIEALIASNSPHVLVIDQLRNIKMGTDNRVLELEQAATRAREWAKKHNIVVVSTTQAGDSASGKAVLDLGDVDFSNTGIPAQADLMVGLGATDKNAMRGEIVLSLPKNKVSGNHEWFTVLTNPLLSELTPLE